MVNLSAGICVAPSSRESLVSINNQRLLLFTNSLSLIAAYSRFELKGLQSRTRESKSMKIVVIGGTGLIGSKAVAILRQGGHEVVAASPKSGINTITGEGLKEAMAGAL